MKKNLFKLVLGIVIVVASFLSFVYLNTASPGIGTTVKGQEPTEQQYLKALDDERDGYSTLPDIHLIIEAVETAKKVIPAF